MQRYALYSVKAVRHFLGRRTIQSVFSELIGWRQKPTGTKILGLVTNATCQEQCVKSPFLTLLIVYLVKQIKLILTSKEN